MSTQDNLMEAFAGESQANRRYLAFARKADKDGFPNVARIYRAIAEAETVHALKHLEVAGEIGEVADNLVASEEGERHEYTVMYPEFIEEAEEEGHSRALRGFRQANEAEKVHGKIFSRLLTAVQKGDDGPGGNVEMCPVCGWVGLEDIPERCPICNTPSERFESF
ncbi:MAG: rubrerythrin family protein [Bacillota bacterium]